jgi:hypothetical protein
MKKNYDLPTTPMLGLNFILLLERVVLAKSIAIIIWSFVKLSKEDLNCASYHFASKL